jgi:hypothetical protein
MTSSGAGTIILAELGSLILIRVPCLLTLDFALLIYLILTNYLNKVE